MRLLAVWRRSTDVRILQSTALAARGLLLPTVTGIAVIGVLPIEVGVATLVFVAIGVTWSVIAVVGTAIVMRLAHDAYRSEALGLYTA